MKLSELLTGAVAVLAAFAVARSGASDNGVRHVPQVVAPSTAPLSASAPPPFSHGRARMIHAPTPCHVPTFSVGGPGAPYFVADGVPHIGVPFRVDWTTKPTSPCEPPALPAILMVSFERIAPHPMDVAGAPGCYLMVEPEFLMVPHAGSILTQCGGRVRLDWTPHRSVIGQDFYAQLWVAAPGVNAAGFLVSPLLHAVVGS